MIEEEEIEEPPRRAPHLADVLDVAVAWAIGVGVSVALGVAAVRESFTAWRRAHGW